MRAKAQRFTPVEIQAETFRQRIRELERLGLEFEEGSDFMSIEYLQDRLARLEEPARLERQNRILMDKYSKMLSEFQESNSVPSNAEDLLLEYDDWMVEVEDYRREKWVSAVEKAGAHWWATNWKVRRSMVYWLGRDTVRRFTVETVHYYVGRAAIGWALKMFRKGR